MIDLKDTTFNIPLRFDSKERQENVELVIDYLNTFFKTQVTICEESVQPRFEYLKKKGCRYVYVQSNSPVLHRTKCLNLLTDISSTPIICNCDSDVLFKVDQYVDAVENIRKNSFDGCFPYGGKFYDTPRKFIPLIRESLSLDAVQEKNCRLLNSRSLGGAIFWRKQAFIEGGMENEKFLGWGYEDNELILRFKRLGYRIGRTEGDLFHLHHPRRSINSFNSFRKTMGYLKNPVLRQNKREFKKIKSMTQDDLRRYVRHWKQD